MSELFKVHFLKTLIRTCFFYLNESDIKNDINYNSGIKIQFGTNYERTTYGSISLQLLPEVPTKSIGVSSLLGDRLGLKEGENVLVSYCDIHSINALEISPKKEEDYVILVSSKSILESHILNQVRVVAEGQTLPLYVFTNIVIDVEIGKLQSEFNFGQLEKFTEITILYPSVKKVYNKLPINKTETISQNKLNHILNNFNTILKNVNSSKSSNVETEIEYIMKEIIEEKKINGEEYVIKPSFLLEDQNFKKLQERFIIVSNFENNESNFGPSSLKVICKVLKINENQSRNRKGSQENIGTTEGDGVVEQEKKFVHVFVISLNGNEKNIAYCPPSVMKKLNLYVGSKIKIERVKTDLSVLLPSRKIFDNECEDCFWKSMADIRENIKFTIVKNIQHDYKINTLLIGNLGSGKTFLCKDLVNEFSNEFIYCKIIHCKSWRGKKIDAVVKLWNDCLRDCCSHEPSLLFLDDLHALTYVEDEDAQFNDSQYKKCYSNCVAGLISENLIEFQSRHNVSVIATATGMTQLSAIVLSYGPRLFENVCTIPEMDPSERSFALKNLIEQKTKCNSSSLDLNQVLIGTNGFTIQNLNDLVEKAFFSSLLRNGDNSPTLDESDFNSALSESIPFTLKGVKKKDSIEKKWEDVGGMAEPKKILNEIFSWPSKYPEILQSCPLRLQRGVLLYGAPGTGKTILAGALANKCGLNFISVKGPEVLSKYVGASEEGVRNLFLQAQKSQPALLFFDEFDSLAPKRGHDSTGVTDRVVNQLLTQLDGVEALQGVWVLAATSRPDLIDSAMLRPGRLDKLVFCPLPDQNDRLSILKALSRNLPLVEDIDLVEIAEKSEGYTGADIQAILYNAQIIAFKENREGLEGGVPVKIEQRHLLAALSETKPSLSSLEKMNYEIIYKKFLNLRKGNIVESYTGTQKVTLA